MIPIIGGTFIVVDGLSQTKENTKDITTSTVKIDRIYSTLNDMQLQIQRNQFIDSLMFVNQAKMMKKMHIDP